MKYYPHEIDFRQRAKTLSSQIQKFDLLSGAEISDKVLALFGARNSVIRGNITRFGRIGHKPKNKKKRRQFHRAAFEDED